MEINTKRLNNKTAYCNCAGKITKFRLFHPATE